MPTRRHVFTGLAAGSASLAMPSLLCAQGYPSGQTIKVVVPFAAGGTTDITGRVLADSWGKLWGTSVIVENVPGAQGNVGNDRVAKAPADGTNILICTPAVTTNQFLFPKLAYDPEKDLQYVSQTVRIPNLLVVKKDMPVTTVPEFIAYAKAQGGKLNYASPGVGSSVHLAAEIFKRMAGIEMTHVAYRGSGPALNDLVAGSVDVIFENIPSCINLVRGGQIRGIAVTSATKHPLSPEFPTIAETLPGFDVSSFFGVAVRAGTPADIVKKIEADAMAVARDPAVKEKLAGISAVLVGSSSAEFTSFIVAERKRWGQLIAELKIKME